MYLIFLHSRTVEARPRGGTESRDMASVPGERKRFWRRFEIQRQETSLEVGIEITERFLSFVGTALKEGRKTSDLPK